MTVTFNPFTGELGTGTAGPQGIPGPPGPQGDPGPMGPAGDTHRHVQGTSASVWEIPHNLGYYPGGVTVRDSGGDLHVGRVEYIDENNIRISFFVAGQLAEFAGEAFIS